jgi:phosphate acetyltransferase
MNVHHDRLIERCQNLPPMRTAVVHPCDALALESALVAGTEQLIVPVLVGNAREITDLARTKRLDLQGCELVPVSSSREAAARAVELARTGEVDALMKGSLHSDELLHAIASPDSGLHTGRRLSHAYVIDLPTYPQPLLISDAVVNITPSLAEKREIVQNAIDLAYALGIAQPRVALLSAIETVNPKIASTVDAAALCKMADRMQITGGILDGPFALDDAISIQASSEKHIASPVAGRANVLIVPDFESGNMLAKALIHLARASAAGIILGATVPIAFTSRADDVMTHTASLAIARLLAARNALSYAPPNAVSRNLQEAHSS